MPCLSGNYSSRMSLLCLNSSPPAPHSHLTPLNRPPKSLHSAFMCFGHCVPRGPGEGDDCPPQKGAEAYCASFCLQDTFSITTKKASLDIFLPDGRNIKVEILTSDTAERVLEVNSI